jgi:hypothetical protein
LSDGRFGCGRVLDPQGEQGYGARTWFTAAILDWVGEAPPTTESIAGAGVLETGRAHISAISDGGNAILGLRPLQLDGIQLTDEPVMGYWGTPEGMSGRVERQFVAGDPPPQHDFREVASPLTDEMLRPPSAPRGHVQFRSMLTEPDLKLLAKWLERFPAMTLRVYGAYDGSIRDLEFLRFFPRLRRFDVDALHKLESIDGLRHLPEDTEEIALGATERRHDLTILSRFPRLMALWLERQTKGIEVISTLTSLRDVSLRSITLPDLTLLRPLTNIELLDLKLGGTRDLSLLPEIGRIRYLELWQIRGLNDISAVGRMPHLEALFLQALKGVATLPDFSGSPRLTRIALETMKGIRDVNALTTAAALEELVVGDTDQLQPEDFKVLAKLPTLKRASVFLGSNRKNKAVKELLGLPPVELRSWRAEIAA